MTRPLKGWHKMWVLRLLGTVVLAMTCGSLFAAPSDHSERANCQLDVDPTNACRFSIDEAKYEINSQGHILKSVIGATPRAAQLPFDGWVLDTLLYMPYEHDLILLCEVGDGESEGGLIFRLHHDLVIKWSLKFPAFNLSVGALEDRFLYQAGIGTIAKVDLERGMYVWSHENLYDAKQELFNSFRKPDVGPYQVIFQEELTSQSKRPARSIRVDKQSGRVLAE